MAPRRITTLRPLLLAVLAAAALGVGTAAALLLWSRPATAIRTIPGATCSPSSPCLALVIDDVGRDLDALHRLLRIDAELTFSVLPHAAHTGASLAALRAAGREHLLHLPMDPLDRSRITDEPIVVGRERPIAAKAQACLDRVPGAVGVNNHMGSALSTDEVALRELLPVIARAGLPVLDSRTADRSRICQVARTLQIPCLERDVFLDDPHTPLTLTSAWSKAEQVARQRGWAVVIGHPYPSTVEALPVLLRRTAVKVVSLSQVIGRTCHLTGQDAGI